jgi:regulator of cell morphogenesis and NO signaling
MITRETSIKASVELNQFNQSVLFRYGIYTRQELSIEKAATDLMINPDFLVDVLNCYSDISVFEIKKFESYSVPVLIEYLQKSHDFYRFKKLLEIEQSVFNLMIGRIGSYNSVSLISLFYTEYKKELLNHFSLEENILFPYGKALSKAKSCPEAYEIAVASSKKHSIKDFEESHKESHDELDRVRESLGLFRPSKSDESALRVLLDQFKSFETDLYLHSLIEDEVLVPKLLALEEGLK